MELPSLKNEALVYKVSVFYLFQSPIQAWVDGVSLHQICSVGIAKRTFWWFNLSVCSTNLHIWSDIRDTLNELQLSDKLLQLSLKGFSQASWDIHFPLSPYFQGLLENKWLVIVQRDRNSYLVICFPERKENENSCLPLRDWTQSKLKLCLLL